MLVTLDQQTALVVGREVHRADHPVAPALAQPTLRGVQQRTGSLGVVLTLEPAEQAPLVVLEAVEVPIDVRADPPDCPAIAPGEEVLRFGVLEEGVLLPVQPLLDVHQQRRDPIGLVTIEPPGKLDERSQLAPVRDRSYIERHAGGHAT
jgi:hypothetical protein